MAVKVFSVKSPATKRELTVSYDFGEDLAGAIALTNEAVVFSQYMAKAVISAQDTVRRLLNDPANSLEQVADKFAAWKLGVAQPRGGRGGGGMAKLLDNLAKGAVQLDDLPEEQLDAVNQRIKENLAKRKADKNRK